MQNTQSTSRKKLILFTPIVLFAALLSYCVFHHPKPPTPPPPPPISGPKPPTIFRTQGGLLDVAGFDFTENFYKSDPLSWWGVNLGTTVSQIEIPARYRYHIELQREWKVIIHGQTCLVASPELQPTLPVAINTAGMKKKTDGGWARFNKDDNLQQLELSLTAELEKKAKSEQYVAQIREAGRKTIAEFITTWLLREQQWKNDEFHTVKVYFPGEEPESSKRTPINLEIKQ